jgi:hypothetical protein
VDPRLRTAVDTSLAWYDDVFALHAVPTRTAPGLWWATADPPPWHSRVKTTEPGVSLDRVLAARTGPGAVADSFGDLDLRPHGFTLLVDATWVHHPAVAGHTGLPGGWSVVRDPGLLAEWSRAHDYAGVLLPAVLDRPAFSVLARHSGETLTAGAVLHRPSRQSGTPRVGLSNTWTADGSPVDHDALLAVVGALHPGAEVSDYTDGADLDAMLRAGYTALGPQRVWLPADT